MVIYIARFRETMTPPYLLLMFLMSDCKKMSFQVPPKMSRLDGKLHHGFIRYVNKIMLMSKHYHYSCYKHNYYYYCSNYINITSSWEIA